MPGLLLDGVGVVPLRARAGRRGRARRAHSLGRPALRVPRHAVVGRAPQVFKVAPRTKSPALVLTGTNIIAREERLQTALELHVSFQLVAVVSDDAGREDRDAQ